MNAIWEQINSAGLIFVEFALPMLVQSSVLILILLLADFALRKKVRAVFRYGIWLLVLIKLVLPTSLSAPLSLGYFFGNQLAYVDGTETTTETAQTAPAIVSPMIDPPRIEAGSDTSAIAPTTPTIEPAVTEPVNTQVVSATPLSWQGAVFLAWLTVVLTMGLLLLQRAIFVRGLVAQAKEANDSMADTLESCRERIRAKRKIGLKVSANATSPAVCGLFRPVILVPKNLASNLNSGQLRAVLLHELAHIRRGDLWINLAQTFLQIIYFYNPLLWLANAIIRRIREQAVDEMVLVAMGEKAQQYPQTLVDVAKLAFKRPALSLRLIGVVESKSALAGRIKHILNRPMPKRAKLGILGLLIVIITAAILLPMAKSMPGPPELIIKGIVKDAQTGEPIAGARVFDDGYGPEPNWEQIKADERSEWGAITNSAGEYSFLTWPEHHSIKVEAPDYKSERRSLYDGHFVFNKKDEETFDFALEPEKVLKSSEFKTKLPNDITVELIGICEHPSEGKQWWQPDGTELSKEIRVRSRGRVSTSGIPYNVAVKVTMPEDATFKWGRIKGETGGISLEAVDSEGRPISNMWSLRVYIDEQLTATSIQLGAADGPWKTRARDSSRGGKSTAGIVFSKAYESDGAVRIIVADEHLDLDYRIAAIDTQGKEHLFHQRGGSAGKVRQTTALFHDIKLNQIEYFLFQTRPFQLITFHNVSLKPGVKTDVQVEVEGGAPKQLTSGGGYQNLSREQRERLERRQANRQSLSYKNMQKLGLAVAVFANDHKGRCPSNLSDLRKYIADEQIFDWINRNVVYLGKNQQYRAPPDAVLAYDESMLKKTRQETNVLYNDAHVSFEKSEWLQEQGIILEQKPAGVELNEKSINSDSKVKVGGIVQVEDKPVVGEWEDIGKAIPADCNETILLAEHITLDSIGRDVEEKVFITLLRDRVKTKNQQYRFILVRSNDRVVEPAGYKTLVFGHQLWERFSFDMPYHHRQIKEFRLQSFPQNLERKASLPVVKPYDPDVNGKIAAQATSGPPGRGALHFDGKGDYLYVPDSQSLWLETPFTVEIWIKPEFPKEELENWPSWGLISKGCTIGTGRVKPRGFGITLNRFKDDPNLLMVNYSTADDNSIYGKSYGRRDFDDWVHLYHVFSHEHYEPGHGHPLVVGKFLIPESPFAGQISEIRIWSGARSRDQFAQDRNKPLIGDEPDLVACWTFEQSGGQIAYDISPNGNHARLGKTKEVDDADPKWVDLKATLHQPGQKTDVQVEVEQGNESSESKNTEDYGKIPSDSVVVRVVDTKGRIIPIKDVPYTRIYYRDATTGNPIGWQIDLQIKKALSNGSFLVNHRDVLVRKFLGMNRETKRNDYTISMCFQPKEGPVFSATTLYPQKATDILSFVVPPRTKVAGVGNVAPDELAGRVVDVDGNPVAGATISIYPDRGLENHPFKTDSQGAFRIPGFGDRWCLYIKVEKDGYATQWLTDFEIGKSFIVTMDQSTVLQGVFVNDSGEQAGRTHITLAKNKLTMQPRRGNSVGPITITHETDDKGSYDFPAEPGLYDVKVASESGFFNRSRVFIGAGQIVSLPSTLKPGIRFQVKVVDSLTNKPIKGVDLWIDSRTPGRVTMKEGSRRTTDSKGLAVWESLMPGNTSFSIRKKGYCRWWSDACLRGLGTLEPVNNRAAYSWQRNIDSLGFDLTPDMPVVVIKMEEGVKLSGLVLSPDGKPVEKAAVDVTPVEHPNTLTGDSRYRMITDANGLFGIKEKYWRGYVPAGKQVLYNLCAHDPEARWANAVSKPFASKPGDEFEFTLKMTKGGSVSGRVIDSEGKPVPDIEVEAIAKDNLDTPYFKPRTLTDENGTFTLGPMREGKYWIQPDTMKGVNIARSPKQEKTEVKVVDGKVTSVGNLLFRTGGPNR